MSLQNFLRRHALHGLWLLPALACAQPEMPTVIPSQPLPALQTTAQWEPLAQHVVHNILAQIPANTTAARLYVTPPSPRASALEWALHQFIVTRLVHSGVAVLTQPQRAQMQLSLHTRLLPLGPGTPPRGHEVLLSSRLSRGDRLLASYSRLYTLTTAESAWLSTPSTTTIYPVHTLKVVAHAH